MNKVDATLFAVSTTDLLRAVDRREIRSALARPIIPTRGQLVVHDYAGADDMVRVAARCHRAAFAHARRQE